MENELTRNQRDSIREGIKSKFPQFIAEAVRLRTYESQNKTLVFTLTLNFTSNVTLSDVDSYNPLDKFTYIGRRFAKDLQVQMARLLPEGHIENKVIMHVKEYDNLRRRALSCPASPMFDSDFGSQFGTHP